MLDGIAAERFYSLTKPRDAEYTEEWAAGVRERQLMQVKIAASSEATPPQE